MKNLLPTTSAIFSWLLILTLVVYINLNVLPMYDDWVYSVRSVGEIIPQVIHEYMTWNGRIINTIGARLFSLLPIWLVELITCCGWIIYLALIGYLALGKHFIYSLKQWYTPLLLWCTALFFILDLWFTSTWHTGTTSYLWTANIAMGFLACFRPYLEDDRMATTKGHMLWLAPLALLAGWSNYNIGPTLCAAFTFFIFWKRKQFQSLYPMFLLLGVMLIGTLFMIAAPGNTVRADGMLNQQTSLGMRLLRNLMQIQHLTLLYLPAFLLFVAGAVCKWIRGLWNQEDTRVLGMALGCAVVSSLAYLASPIMPTAYSFHFVGTMYAVAMVRIYYPYLEHGNGKCLWRLCLLAATLLPVGIILTHTQPSLFYARECQQKDIACMQAAQGSHRDLVIPRHQTYENVDGSPLTDYWGVRLIAPFFYKCSMTYTGSNITPMADSFGNVAAAHVHGLKSVRKPYYQASYTARMLDCYVDGKEFLTQSGYSITWCVHYPASTSASYYFYIATPKKHKGLQWLKAQRARNSLEKLTRATPAQLKAAGYTWDTPYTLPASATGHQTLRTDISQSWIHSHIWVAVTASRNASPEFFVPLHVI